MTISREENTKTSVCGLITRLPPGRLEPLRLQHHSQEDSYILTIISRAPLSFSVRGGPLRTLTHGIKIFVQAGKPLASL
jgi:hypothetical protein